MSTRWDQRFFASTKGQVAALLRRGVATVDAAVRSAHGGRWVDVEV